MSIIRFPPGARMDRPPPPARYMVWSRWLDMRMYRIIRHLPDWMLSALAFTLLSALIAFAVWAVTHWPR